MKDIELALRDTLRAAASAAPPGGLNLDAMTAGASRRRSSIIVAAGVAALLVTGTGVILAAGGNLGADDTPATALTGTPIVVATSNWKTGDDANQALLAGTLLTTPEGCPYVDVSTEPAHPSPVALVWPAGYQARRAPGGEVHVTGPDGTVMIREGDRFEAGGGYTDSKDRPCTLGAAQAFLIQSSISRDPSNR